MSDEIEFWIDPACPWCWVTARWIVEEVRPHRDIHITWQPISLFFKNSPDPSSQYYEPVRFTHRLLRVIEAVRAKEGDEAIEPLYWELGRRIHHDQDRGFDPADALRTVGLDASLAAAFDDEAWDAEIRTRMDAGLALAGDDVGTPIISFPVEGGGRQAFFGPVITRVPPTDVALRLWDGVRSIVDIPGFWEIKRTRTEGPDYGARP